MGGRWYNWNHHHSNSKTAKQKLNGRKLKRKQKEINEGEMQRARNSPTIIKLRWDNFDHNNCSPNRFAKKKFLSRLCQYPRNAVGYASLKPNKFYSIKTARILNKTIIRNALCQAKAGQSHQHAFSQNMKDIAWETHSPLPPKVSTSQCCILSAQRITAASILTLTKFTFDWKNCQSRQPTFAHSRAQIGFY